jgi:hypothetical protein
MLRYVKATFTHTHTHTHTHTYTHTHIYIYGNILRYVGIVNVFY